MYDLPLATLFAAEATATLARSARPDAPIVADPQPHTRRSPRRALATGLHRLAHRLASEHTTGTPAGVH